MKKILRIIARSALVLCAFTLALALTLFVAAQIAAWAGFVWLNTNPGQHWLQARIDDALGDTGYDIGFSRLSYATRSRLIVSDLRVADANGPILNADRLILTVDILPLLHKELQVALEGGHVSLLRLPEGGETTDAPPAPLALDDLYFKKATIRTLELRALDIAAAVAGADLHLAPRLQAVAVPDSQLHVTLAGRLYGDQPNPAWLPQSLSARLRLNPQSWLITLEQAVAAAPAYRAQGLGTVAADGAIDLNLSVRSDNLEPLIPGQPGTAQIDARLHGPSGALALEAAGTTTLAILTARALGPVAFNGKITDLSGDPAGTIHIDTHYRDLPVGADTAFRFEDPVLTLGDLSLTGPDLTAQGTLSVDTQTGLASGNLSADAPKLETYAALAGQDIAGAAKLTATLLTDNGQQGVDGTLTLAKARLDGNRIDSATIKATIPSVETLWPVAMDVQAHGLSAGSAVTAQRLNATVKREDDAYRLAIDMAGTAARAFTLTGGALVSGIDNGAYAARAIDLTLGAAGGTITAQGSAGLQALALHVTTKNLTPGLLADGLPPLLSDMALDAQADITGAPAAPVIAATVKGQGITPVENGPTVILALDARYEDGQARAHLTGTGDGIDTLRADAQLPVTLSLYPFTAAADRDAALSGTAVARLSGRTLARMFLPPGHLARGDVAADATLGGTLAIPRVDGTLSVADGDYAQPEYGVALHNITLQAQLSPEQVNVKTLRADDGQSGKIDGGGLIDLRRPAQTALKLRLDNMHLLKHGQADAFVTGNIAFDGRADGYALTGTLHPEPVEITIPERFQGTIPQLNIVTKKEAADQQAAPALTVLALDLTIDAPQRVFVRGWGLDAEFGGKVTIGGTLREPLLNGDLSAIRGRYEEFGKRFTLDRAKLRFQGKVPPSPYLDIKADTDADDVTASVLLTGPVMKPGIKLSSSPALPEDEVMSRILFGKDMSRITPFQAVQLTQTLQRLSGNGGNTLDPLGQIRNLTGLDDLHVDTDSSGAAAVGAGKYLTDKVYLEFEKGAENTGGARIQVEVTPQISVESKIGQDAQGGGGVFWKKDY